MRKGAVTIFEIAALAILGTVLVVVYNVFAQSVTQNIVLGTANAIRNQECSMTLFVVYNKDYKRTVDFEQVGGYAHLREFYNIPTKYDPQDMISEITGFEPKMGLSRNAKCTTYVFDPASLYSGGNGMWVVSGE